MKVEHLPVLLDEVLSYCEGRPIRSVLDGTIGFGGHAEALLRAHPEIERYVGLDQDLSALALARSRLEPIAGERLELRHANFSEPPTSIGSEFDLILLDIGVSSMQLDQAERGFSFMRDGPLDMRMNRDDVMSETAEELVNRLPHQELADLFWRYGEESHSRKIAKAIYEKRKKGRITSTLELASCIEEVCPRRGKAHPATKVFQALRIAVNRELQVLESALDLLPSLLRQPGGRLCVISFHSMEDRIVKQKFQSIARTSGDEIGAFHIVTKKPIPAGRQEIRQNPRSRSAKLRVLERL